MGFFTEWIEQRRAGGDLPFPPEEAEILAKRLFDDLERKLRSRISSSRFGEDSPKELSAEQVLSLLTKLEAQAEFPSFVVNYATLKVWVFRTLWSSLCRIWKGRHKGPQLHGLSEAARNEDGSINPHGMDTYADERHRGGVVDFDDLLPEFKDSLDIALQDLEIWKGPPYREAFIEAYLNERPHQEVAKEQGVSPGSLSRRLDAGKFCFARRLGYSPEELAKEFDDPPVGDWLRSLTKALENADEPR